MAAENINRKLNIYINDKEVVNSLSGITREMGKTRNELKHLNKNSEDYDKDLARLTKHLADLNEKQGEFRDELQLTNKEMSAARENFSNLLGGLASGDMKAVQDGMLAIRGSIVASTQAAMAFVMTPIGAFVAAFAGLGLAAKQVVDFNESIKETNKLLDNLGVDRNLRPAIQAIAETYEVGFDSLANAIDNMVDLGLVKNEFEALEKIKEGLVKAPDKNGFLAMLDANGIAAKNLGLQLEDIISLNESFEATGANAEAIFGALQKSSSTLILQSPQLKKSLENAFGSSFTSDLLNQVKSGTITYYDALDKIYKKGEELGLSNQKQAQLAKDLFGKSAIAAGGYEMIMGNVATAQGKQTEALTETQKETKRLADANIELAQEQDRALKADGYNRWKNNALLAINSVKKGWYSLVSGLMNSEQDMINAAKQTGAENRIKDESKNFNDYMDNRKKRLGAAFDWEKERAEHLAEVNKRMNANWNTDKEQKSFDLQISSIKNAKNPNAKKQTPDGPSDEDTKGADAAAKKREKQLADAKKHSEDLLKQENDLQKELNDSRAKANELKFGLIQDDYTRERDLLNADYDKKIEDLQLNIKKEQDAIDKLKAGIASPKSSAEDVQSFKKQLADRLEIQANYNSSLVSTEQTRDLKLGALQEKYLQKDIQDQEQANARALQNLQTKQNNELSSITTLEEAKAVLSSYLTEDELKKITSLEEAKKKVKQQFQDEELTLQQKHLVDMVAQIATVFEQENLQGIELITPEQREILLKFLDDAAAKLSALGISKAENKGEEANASKDLKSLSGIDILGFNPEQWQSAFDSLDTFAEKIAAVEMVVGAVKNAFGMYFQFLEAGEKRTMQKFEANNRKKQSDLDTQLEKGYITQEVYNARKSKLEAELAKKTAELEYKKAKRQKIQSAAEILINTGIAVSKAIAASPLTLGMPWSGIIAGLGAAQLGLVLAQPLPDKNGFYDGGYTGSGPERNSPGPVHYDEYVVPKKVLFSNDPVVPNIVGYLEAKRTGKNPQMPQQEQANTQINQSASGGNIMDVAVVNALNRNSLILEKIEEDGLPAYLVNDIKTAKKMRDKIKEVNKLETNAKL